MVMLDWDFYKEILASLDTQRVQTLWRSMAAATYFHSKAKKKNSFVNSLNESLLSNFNNMNPVKTLFAYDFWKKANIFGGFLSGSFLLLFEHLKMREIRASWSFTGNRFVYFEFWKMEPGNRWENSWNLRLILMPRY